MQLPLIQRSLLQKRLLSLTQFFCCSFFSSCLHMTYFGEHKLTHPTLSSSMHVKTSVQLLTLKLCPTSYCFPFALKVCKKELLRKNTIAVINQIKFFLSNHQLQFILFSKEGYLELLTPSKMPCPLPPSPFFQISKIFHCFFLIFLSNRGLILQPQLKNSKISIKKMLKKTLQFRHLKRANFRMIFDFDIIFELPVAVAVIQK